MLGDKKELASKSCEKMFQSTESKCTSKINTTEVDIKTDESYDVTSENNNCNNQRNNELQVSRNQCNFEPR